MPQPMMDDIADLLVTLGLGIKSGVGADLFGGYTPPSPDNAVMLFESTGFEPERTMNGVAMEVLNLQVLVRNVKTVDAQTRAKAIFVALDRFNGLIGTVRYFSILARHSPFPIGMDENRRWRWTCNYKVWKALS